MGQGRVIRAALLVVAFIGVQLALVAAPPSRWAAAAAPAFVQARAKEITSGTTNSLAFSSANTAGNLIIAYVVWNNGGTVTLGDTRGNVYSPVAPATKWNNNTWSSEVFYSKNIAGGVNTVTATFGTSINSFGILYIHEYSGMDRVNPVDVTRSAIGTSSAMSSGTVTTTYANDLIFGAGASTNNVNQAGSGFTTRSTAYGNRTEDRIVTATGTSAATANQNGTGWVMHVVAFKGAPSDATAPTVPTGLSATPVSTSQVNLAWTASTDNIGVTGYRVFRNGTQVGTPTGTTFQDTGLSPSTLYNYTVSAYDAAGNTSAQTANVPATTLADTTPPTVPTGLTATPMSSTQINLGWTASTDDVAVTGYTVYRNGTQVGTATGTTFQDVNLTPSTAYSYSVGAYDAAGNSSAQTAAVNAATLAPPDTTPPSVPANIVATPASSSQVNLAWDPSADNVSVAGYNVYRNGTLVGSPGTTLYQDTGLTASTTYSYTVAAFDGAANTSAQSQPVSATTLAPPVDSAPPTAAMTAPAAGSVLLGTVTLAATATDDVAVVGVQFLLDGANLGTEDSTSPYSISWDSTTVANGTHVLAARSRDGASHLTTSTPITVTVNNPSTPPGLVAGYAFDEGSGTTAADSSGHSLTGTLTNGATWRAGHFGSAVGLDGVDDFVSLGNPTSLQFTGSMTISAWIYSTAFPADDAAIVSKRTSNGYQLDTTVDTGSRVLGLKLTNSSGADMFRYGATTLQPNTWYYVTGVYDATARTIDVYLNGQLDNGPLLGTITSTQQNSSGSVLVGQRSSGGFNDIGGVDNVRLYGRALSAAEIQTDMNAPLGSIGASDPTPPSVSITAPAQGSQVSGITSVTADAADNVGVSGVQFFVDGVASGPEDTASPYALTWDSRTAANGSHTLTARARDAAGNSTLSAAVTVNVANTNYFQNEILATNFNLPTAMKFLPDGRLLIAELAGRIRVVPPPYTTPDPTLFLQLTNIGSAGVQQGIFDLALDPNFTTNHYYYIFYTLGSPNVDRLSRFTANATLTGTVAGSETVFYQDPTVANAEHHGGAIMFGNDGKLYFTTGDHFDAATSQNLDSPRGKVHRLNLDGTVPTDNPFYDGNGPHWDSVWALGLRNPYRAFYDGPTGRMFIGDVGGNDYSTAVEEVDVGGRGANFGWADYQGPCPAPSCTSPLYSWPHNGRDSAVTGGFVYHGNAFPAGYDGSYFFADYTQNWIRRLTLDASGNLTGVYNFEPMDGSVDGPYGDIVYLLQGPDGALYYLDLGYSDISGSYGISKLRRIKYIQSNQAPVAAASASTTSGPAPLSVDFSSTGSFDPEGAALTYLWNFGDNVTSSQANPNHVYTQAGTYSARLTVSDGVNTTTSSPITISVGNRPVATITSPVDGSLFVAGDVITFSGDATDTEDGTLPASAFTWSIDFLHEGHVHPGTQITGVKNGTFTIPITGHDFSGNTRYRITLTVLDSSGLSDTKSVIIWPTKVNLTFATAPTGLTLYLDGIAKVAPFVYDTLVGFNHTIEARNQSANGNSYTFTSWSDGTAQSHTLVVPATAASYTATYSATPIVGPIAFVQQNYATPQNSQTSVAVPFLAAQSAGDLNVVVVGWSDVTSSIASVQDGAGNTYQLAAPVTRGSSVSQAIYFANNIAARASNTVTVTFNQAAAYADVRIVEYSGIDATNPFDKGASASGSGTAASSGTVTTTAAKELVFGAGTTTGAFTSAGTGFTSRVITSPDADIVEDRTVTATGSYSATANQNGNWVMQVVTFRGAAQ